MLPIPNVIAGVLIGIANTGWIEVLGSALVWPAIYCLFVLYSERARVEAKVAQFRENAKKLIFHSPVVTFYTIEFITALFTALPVACVTFLIKTVLN